MKTVATLVLLGGAAHALAQAPPNHAFFENRVRPILVEHCYECHSEKSGKRKGDLLLDRPSGRLGGDPSRGGHVL